MDQKSTLMRTLLQLQQPLSGSNIGKWSEQRRDRVSAATDCHPERLPGIRERNCSLGCQNLVG